MQNKCFKNKKNRAGFSLLEVMISIFVLAIGLVALITLMSKSLVVSMEARDRIIAAQLAQEGLELAINAISNNRLNDINYDLNNHVFNNDTNLIDINDKCTYLGGEAAIDYKSLEDTPPSNNPFEKINQWGSSSCPSKSHPYSFSDFALKYHPNYGYQYTYGSNTKFKRQIHIWYSGSSDKSNILTCTNNIRSFVVWGDRLPYASDCTLDKKCATAIAEIKVEKDPANPKCTWLNLAEPSVTYP